MKHWQRKPLPTVTDCNDCGVCCTGQSALPLSWYLGKTPGFGGDPASLPPELLAELRSMLGHFNVAGWPDTHAPCVWYDPQTKRCKHYEHRPDICKDLPVGGEACLRWREMKGVGLPRLRVPTLRLVNGKFVRS